MRQQKTNLLERESDHKSEGGEQRSVNGQTHWSIKTTTTKKKQQR